MTFIRKILKPSFKLFFYQKSRKIVDWHLYEDMNCSSLMIAEFASYNYFRFSILKMSDHNFKRKLKSYQYFRLFIFWMPKVFYSLSCLCTASDSFAHLSTVVQNCAHLYTALNSFDEPAKPFKIIYYILKPQMTFQDLWGAFRTIDDLK